MSICCISYFFIILFQDANNCILDFDKNGSLFAVYDGHNGPEVAEYCSKKLPDFIKQTENYIKGNFEQALKDAFLGFDETLMAPDVVTELDQIAEARDKERGLLSLFLFCIFQMF